MASFLLTSDDEVVDGKRTLRLVWIALANGVAIYVQYANVRQHVLLNGLLEQESQNRGLWLSTHFSGDGVDQELTFSAH